VGGDVGRCRCRCRCRGGGFAGQSRRSLCLPWLSRSCRLRHDPGRADLPDLPGRDPAGLRLQRGLGPGPQGSAHPCPVQVTARPPPHDLRHPAVSLWLNSGVPATEVTRRAGHGAAVLLKIYAHCVDGQVTAANPRALPGPSASRTPSKISVTRVTATLGRFPEMAVQGGNSGGAVSETAPTGPVRGLSRPRPWPVPSPSVARTAPEPGAPRTHSGRRQPGIAP